MIIKIKLKNPKSCKYCPFFVSKEYNKFTYYHCLLYKNVEGFMDHPRPKQCIEENG